jgi:hypothetical protein
MGLVILTLHFSSHIYLVSTILLYDLLIACYHSFVPCQIFASLFSVMVVMVDMVVAAGEYTTILIPVNTLATHSSLFILLIVATTTADTTEAMVDNLDTVPMLQQVQVLQVQVMTIHSTMAATTTKAQGKQESKAKMLQHMVKILCILCRDRFNTMTDINYHTLAQYYQGYQYPYGSYSQYPPAQPTEDSSNPDKDAPKPAGEGEGGDQADTSKGEGQADDQAAAAAYYAQYYGQPGQSGQPQDSQYYQQYYQQQYYSQYPGYESAAPPADGTAPPAVAAASTEPETEPKDAPEANE